MLNIVTIIGLLASLVGWVVLGAILRGWVLSIMWNWFVVSTFGLPALSIAAAIGVSLVVGLMTYQYIYTEDDRSDSSKIAAGLGVNIGGPLVVLLMGWIVKQFL